MKYVFQIRFYIIISLASAQQRGSSPRWGSDLHHIITTFIFTTLSFNGTNVTRGQVPQILYYSTPAEEPAITNGTANLAQTSRQSALAISVAVKTHHVHV